jgi:hypothetical protein
MTSGELRHITSESGFIEALFDDPDRHSNFTCIVFTEMVEYGKLLKSCG